MSDSKNYASVGLCPICGQGRLIIARDDVSGALYVLCEECESEWASPEESHHIEKASQDTHGASTMLEREELRDHPWMKFLLR